MDPAPLPKNRYISLVPGNAGRKSALRVTLNSLHRPESANGSTPDFSGYEGLVRYVGPPRRLKEIADGVDRGTFWAAQLRCEPYYTDWGRMDVLHVYGSEIIPSSRYSVQTILETCDPGEEANYSPALTVRTTDWGDVYRGADKDDPDLPPDMLDVNAVVRNFTNEPGAPIKASAQLRGRIPNPRVDVDFLDIADAVSAFSGAPYPYSGPDRCPTDTP